MEKNRRRKMYFIPVGEPTRRRRERRSNNSPLDFLYSFEEFQEYMDKKDAEKKKKDKDHPKPATLKDITSTMFWCMTIGPILGVSYLYGIKALLQHLELVLK